MKLRRLREGDIIEADETLLVRGGELDPALLRADALRYHSVYGSYGISVFAVRGATLEELAQQAPLVRRLADPDEGRRGARGRAPAGADRAQPAPLHAEFR